MSRLTASQLYSYLTCPHRVVLDATGDPVLRDDVSPFVQMLWERGVAHEHDLVAALTVPYDDLSALRGQAKETATRAAIARQAPLIYGGRLSVHELLGEPDLLRRESSGYVAIDIKSGAGREGADDEDEGRLRKHYGVQLALYTDILEQMGLSAGRYGYIWDASGSETRYDLTAPTGPRSPCLWDLYLKTRAAVRATLSAPQSSAPALASVCKQCVWRSACLVQLRDRQDLTLLPELGRAARDVLQEEFPSLRHLASADLEHFIEGERTSFARIGGATLRKFQRRARLQIARDAQAYLTAPIQWPEHAVELFFDIETDPLRGLCYLHGFLIRERDAAGRSQERFEGIFAGEATAKAERDAFAAAMALFRRYPDALVVHYSRYERTEYQKLVARYPDVATVEEIKALFASPRALDLYIDVIKPHTEWPTHDYSIKSLAKHCGFKWRDADPSGASSIEWFDRWVKSGDPRLRQRLLAYNEDDCRAMRVVFDHLKTLAVWPEGPPSHRG